MRKAVFGFMQERALEFGLNTDELLFLDWFIYWYAAEKMVSVVDGEKVYGWLDRSYVFDQLPILRFKNEDYLSTVLSKLVRLGLIARVIKANAKERGKKSFFKPTAAIRYIRGDIDSIPSEDQATPEQFRKNKGENDDHLRKFQGEEGGPPLKNQRSDTQSPFDTQSEEDREPKQASRTVRDKTRQSSLYTFTNNLDIEISVPVNMTTHTKLVEKYGASTVETYYSRIRHFCDQNGKRYKDYSATAVNWMDRDGVKPPEKPKFAIHDDPLTKELRRRAAGQETLARAQ